MVTTFCYTPMALRLYAKGNAVCLNPKASPGCLITKQVADVAAYLGRGQNVSHRMCERAPCNVAGVKADMEGAMLLSESSVPIERSLLLPTSRSSHQSASDAQCIPPERPERRSELIHSQPPPAKTSDNPAHPR